MLLLLLTCCSLSVVLSDLWFQSVSTLSKARLSQQSRLCWKSTKLFIPSFPDLTSPVAEEAFVALTVRTVFTGSETFIGGSRGVSSTGIIYHRGLHSAATSPRSTSFDGSEFLSPAKKLMSEGFMCSTLAFMTFSLQFEDLQVQSFSLPLLCRPASSGYCYCSYLPSWTDPVDKWLNYGFGKYLWFRHGNVGDRGLCLTLATASSSSYPVKLIYLNAVLKVARPSLSSLKHPSLATVIHTQQLLNSLYSLVSCLHLLVFVMDLKMEIPSKKAYVLGIGGLFYLFGAVDGAKPLMSSKIQHQPEDPTSTNVRQIQSVARSISMLEDCSPVAFIKMAFQPSSCRGHERSFTSLLLFVEVNFSTKTPLHERYLSLGFKAKEYYHFLNHLLSCVMVRLGPEDTTRFIPMKLEVLECSTSRYAVTIVESEKFEGRSTYSMSLLACGSFQTNFNSLSNLSKFVSLSLYCFAFEFLKRIAHRVFVDVALIHVMI